jgi:hypothetical protein
MASVGTAEKIIDALFWLLEEAHRETTFWNCAYWAPTLLRRIKREPDIEDRLIEALKHCPSSDSLRLIRLFARVKI